ncbi:MAG: hypothetical protein ACM3Z4_18795 [Hyphomicrobiales bacterium]
MDKRGNHALVFPVRKSGTDWVVASTKMRIDNADVIQQPSWALAAAMVQTAHKP